jgi:hypothetical protein
VQSARASKVYLQMRGVAWQNGCARRDEGGDEG